MSHPKDAFARLLPPKLPAPVEAQAHAPSNIALSKYWGKRDHRLNLPLNSSLSISLHQLGSHTRISPSQQDEARLNGTLLPPESAFYAKIFGFVERFRRGQNLPLSISTTNTIPTAAGLASSASGFAALTRALTRSFALNLPDSALSELARYGSGSACRSLWHGFVRWQRGENPDGSDSIAMPLTTRWPEFRLAILAINTSAKAVSSREGMGHTAATSPLFAQWPATAQADCDAIQRAVEAKDFPRLGALAEANALAMHATMQAARPALTYLTPQSWQALADVQALRSQGTEVYATMDAGPNVKLLFEEASLPEISRAFPDATIIAPFAPVPD